MQTCPTTASTRAFLYTVRYLALNNFYIVLDNQLNTDPTCVNDPDVRPSHLAAAAHAMLADRLHNKAQTNVSKC